ncbi:hypothetical protein ARMSODRAFT_979404 [Armillaria solidipes]|uniref:Uncharacterized protein n=1 Tax=Armillaria solidipes TaxID=1076256 RepID=A0A2H3B578_9AGAR|nr:hypothetical protein ARMSODRAFT_979404 [Armillaria solidipes]
MCRRRHLFIAIPYTVSGMSTSDVATLSTSLKKLYDKGSPIPSSVFALDKTFPRFNVRRLAASLVSSILRAANRRFVGVLAGNNLDPTAMSSPPKNYRTTPKFSYE